jgi:hypothetical protein
MGLLAGSLILLGAAVVVGGLAAAIIARVRLSNDERTSGSLGHALSQVQSLIEPSRKNVIEMKHIDERRRDDLSGEPPPRP